MFVTHTFDTAPADSRPAMEATERRFGAVPPAVARLATSPDLLNGFLRLSAAFERTTLDPLARETVVMTVAVRNGCRVCVDIHTAALRGLDADDALVAALHAQEALPDPRLEAVRTFTLDVLRTAGAVEEERIEAFLSHGFTERNALEVVMGIGAYTMSTLANRLVRA